MTTITCNTVLYACSTKIESRPAQDSAHTPTANLRSSPTSFPASLSSKFSSPNSQQTRQFIHLNSKDSMGNTEILKRGSLQLTSAGTGISHSERAHGAEQVHFLQIWSIPHTERLAPKYFTREFSDAQKTNTWLCMVAPALSDGVSLERDGEGPAPVQSALTMYATLLEKGRSLGKTVVGKKGYVQVVQTSGYNTGKASGAAVRVSGVGDGKQEAVLKEGDSTYLTVGEGHGAELIIENVGDTTAEILLFDLE